MEALNTWERGGEREGEDQLRPILFHSFKTLDAFIEITQGIMKKKQFDSALVLCFLQVNWNYSISWQTLRRILRFFEKRVLYIKYWTCLFDICLKMGKTSHWFGFCLLFC